MKRQATTWQWLGAGSIALGLALALNTLLGPLLIHAFEYPFTETVLSETLGLELVSLFLIAPLACLAGVLTLQGHVAGPLLVLGPAGYAAYMLAQYIVGPQYVTYQPAVIFHLAGFVLSGALLIGAWRLVDADRLQPRSRGWAVVAVLLTMFVVSRWARSFSGAIDQSAVPAAASDVSMMWSIYLLDLGIIVPLTLATAVGLLACRTWATKALYGVLGWFALVPPSVTAMALVKIARDDPAANTGDTVVLVVATLVFAILAVALFAPLFRQPMGPRNQTAGQRERPGPKSAPGHSRNWRSA